MEVEKPFSKGSRTPQKRGEGTSPSSTKSIDRTIKIHPPMIGKTKGEGDGMRDDSLRTLGEMILSLPTTPRPLTTHVDHWIPSFVND